MSASHSRRSLRGCALELRGTHSGLSFELVVVLAVVEVSFESPTDPHTMVRSDRDVPAIEQRMDVGSEQEPVAETMTTPVRDRPDVRGLQYRQGLLLRDRAATLIRIGDQDAERPLPQPLQHLDRLAPDRVIALGHPSSSSRPQSRPMTCCHSRFPPDEARS